MANFFKDYQADVKAKAIAKETIKEESISYEQGQIVYVNLYGKINPLIANIERKTKKYFADYLSENHVLLADNKKDALNGYGYIYDISCIVTK